MAFSGVHVQKEMGRERTRGGGAATDASHAEEEAHDSNCGLGE